jgi:predicted nucleotidyltransferase
MNDYLRTLQILCDAGVRFVIIGGAAAAAHGSTYPTYDLDICYDRSHDNIERLAKALEPFHPSLRGVSDELPFCFDAATIANGMNFTLTTDLGDIDLFGEVTGVGVYKDANALSIRLEISGFQCSVLSLEGLIQSKRATARPKDLLMLREIEALREMETRHK